MDTGCGMPKIFVESLKMSLDNLDDDMMLMKEKTSEESFLNSKCIGFGLRISSKLIMGLS
jgi:hypothetical protein